MDHSSAQIKFQGILSSEADVAMTNILIDTVNLLNLFRRAQNTSSSLAPARSLPRTWIIVKVNNYEGIAILAKLLSRAQRLRSLLFSLVALKPNHSKALHPAACQQNYMIMQHPVDAE